MHIRYLGFTEGKAEPRMGEKDTLLAEYIYNRREEIYFKASSQVEREREEENEGLGGEIRVPEAGQQRWKTMVRAQRGGQLIPRVARDLDT